jgi:hypothetical protein
MIGENLRDDLRAELVQMLEEPKYLECFMVKQPLVPLTQNHRT